MNPLPQAEFILDNGYPVEGGDVMEFRLLYKGDLVVSGDIKQKHEIRKVLHPQLKQLWANNESLRLKAEQIGRCNNPSSETLDDFNLGIRAVAEKHFQFNFVPLVKDSFFVRCGLDILFLRREKPGSVVMRGDIDNRLKTLFDALRIPNAKGEVSGIEPEGSEDPMYVLLKNDDLITDIKVTTDQLLMLPEEKFESNQVFLVINVKLQPYKMTDWSHVFM